jgi:hypothetical protein
MTKQEILGKVVEIKMEAHEIDKVEDITKAMKKAFLNNDDPLTQKALLIGFANMLDKAYDNIDMIWVKAYDLQKTLEKDIKAEEKARTIDNDEPVTEDDLPFDGEEGKE